MDRTTKFLLGTIAAGLWANALPHLTGRASAQASKEPVAPKPKPAPAPLAAKPSPCLTGVC